MWKACIVLVAASMSSVPAMAQTLEGAARVKYGDTIVVDGREIRLWGIDAIEGRQIGRDEADREHRCGTYVARSLRSFLRDRPATCNQVDQDRYGRAVAVCALGGVEISEWLVRSGYAIDYVEYSKGAYAAAQEAARRERSGVWIYSWQLPASYRRCMKTKGGNVERCSAQR